MQQIQTPQRGALLVNIGTPDGYGTSDVKRYLGEFLMDERVISLPYFWRALLVKGIILPFRSPRSAAAYKRIWSAEGSPMMVMMDRVARQLRENCRIPVGMGMRYGNPSIENAIEDLRSRGVREILLLPMYPHYTQSTYESALVEFSRILNTYEDMDYDLINPFYNHPDYLSALVQTISLSDAYREADHLLFSFHGVPVSHIRKQAGMPTDYRMECLDTARMSAERLGLEEEQWSVSFQSRMGKGEWTRPYTTDILTSLARKGIRKIAVVTPSFTVDCLENLEEIAMAGRELFLSHGGEELYLIPCLNDHSAWIENLSRWINAWEGSPQPEYR